MGNLVIKFYRILWRFFKRFYLFIFRERGRKGRRVGEKHQCMVASCTPPAGDLACNPGMCPDWELNLRPFGSQARTQFTELHQPGPMEILTSSNHVLRSCQKQATAYRTMKGRRASCKMGHGVLKTEDRPHEELKLEIIGKDAEPNTL